MNDLTPQEVKLLSPLGLAYIGDGIFELLTRTKIILKGNMPVNKLHKKTVEIVCASAQSQGLEIIMEELSEEEEAIYKRGRNATGNHVPKNSNPQEYHRATGLEALFGFLYLTGNYSRIEELHEKIFSQLSEAKPLEQHIAE